MLTDSGADFEYREWEVRVEVTEAGEAFSGRTSFGRDSINVAWSCLLRASTRLLQDLFWARKPATSLMTGCPATRPAHRGSRICRARNRRASPHAGLCSAFTDATPGLLTHCPIRSEASAFVRESSNGTFASSDSLLR